MFVNPVLCPAVPEGRELLRTSYMATHTDDLLMRVLEIFGAVGRQVGLIAIPHNLLYGAVIPDFYWLMPIVTIKKARKVCQKKVL